MLPHFTRMSLDGRFGYVANLNGHHISRIDLQSFALVDTIALDGFDAQTPTTTPEGGFADVQIDQETGLLYAAHRETGRVMVYDTVNAAEGDRAHRRQSRRGSSTPSIRSTCRRSRSWCPTSSTSRRR